MPMKKKDEIPQGKNELTATIEKIMQDFGGTKYKAYTVSSFLQEGRSAIAKASEHNNTLRFILNMVLNFMRYMTFPSYGLMRNMRN